MYDRKYFGARQVKARFKDGVEEFVTYAMSQDIVQSEGGVRCPCIKCMCGLIQSPEDVIDHLEKVGFMDDYYVWTHHGEREPANINTEFNVNMHASSSGAQRECGNFGRMQDMVGDALGVNMSYEGGGEEAIIPNDKALKFYAMMEEVNKPLYEGASDSKLSICVRFIAAKSNWNVHEDCLEFFSKMMLDTTPIKDNLPTNYYDAKRLVSKLGLQVKKIDCFVQGCMLFYDNEFSTNDGALEECKFCKAPRYQVLRLYWDKIGKFLQEHPEYSCHEAIPNTIRREIWLDRDVAGPGTYGFGKLAPNVRYEDLLHIPTPEERSHLLAFPPTTQAEIQRLTQESQTQREEINRLVQKDQEREQMMQEELRKLREEQRQAMEQQKMEMAAHLKKMVASSFQNAPIDETAPHEDSANSNNEDTNTEDSANSNNEDTNTNDAN
ncbi:hypothetical protein TSUD_83730 [Trifolium subterraneum]|uniref:Transposase-associated domain-containing protein n=1 Tax=Trifolium subterraneum TaxID=3900 RepID=A0A2Z6M0F0_TRISU|nr:hypothetical protein TSUD_83730 [Trifolium subterraneum]